MNSSVRRLCREVLPLVLRAVRGRRVLQDVRDICGTDRWNSFDRFHDTTTMLVDRYKRAGASADVLAIPTGGNIGTGRWVIREASDIRSATADIIKPVKRRLLDYRKNPWSVIQWSASTPPEGMAGHLIVLDTPEAIERHRSLAGRIVLTRLNVRSIFRDLSDRGALAVIVDTPIDGYPNAKAWTKFGWGAPGLESAGARLVGLVLSGNEGTRLRALAAKGEVNLHINVDVHPYKGTHDLVSGRVLGDADPQDEIWVLAHSAEPGAHDNASGVALCLETARVLETLIAAGRLPRPKRTIRLLSGFECYSFFYELEHAHRYQTPLAGVCVDTVGAKPAICDGTLSWRSTLPASSGFVDRLGATVLRSTLRRTNPGYRLAEGGFVPTSDTLIGDPKYGFPCPWICTHYRRGGKTWKAYHTSADTPDVLSASGLAACTAGIATYLYYLADAGTPEVLDLVASETTMARNAIGKTRSADKAYFIRTRHTETMSRLTRWIWDGQRDQVLDAMETARRDVARVGPAPPRRSRSASSRAVPRRTRILSPTPENTPVPLKRRISATGLSPWTLFWADGKRNLSEIGRLASVETGRSIDPSVLQDYFDAHRELGYVALVPAGQIIGRARIVDDLRRLGLKPGMDVMVHSSLSSVGHLDGGADTVIDALLQVLGRAGTLMFPSFNHRAALVYNPRTSPTTNGALPDAFWRRRGVVRSDHPTHAVAAYGPRAVAFCCDHVETGLWTSESPIARLVAAGGYVLSLGVTHTSSTAYHVGEMSVPCGCIDPHGGRGQIVTEGGKVQTVRGLAWRNGLCPVSPEQLNRALARRQLTRKVGEAEATLVQARLIVEARRRHLRTVCPTCRIKPLRVEG